MIRTILHSTRGATPPAILAAVLLLLAAVPATADGARVNASAGLTAAGAPLALHGYDAVAYFTDGEPRLGVAEHSHVHAGAAYRFASAEHLEAFRRDPERYLPAFGGFCAYGVSVGAKFDGDPRVWKVVDGKLYLNLSPEIQELWEEDLRDHIDEAEARWPRIRDRSPASLKAGG